MKKIPTGTTLGCALALVLGASACSNPGGGAGPAASGSLDPTASLKGVTLTFWTAQNSVGEPKQVVSAFEKATGATVNTVVVPDPYESNFPTKLASGEKPDLAFWQPTQSTLPFVNPAQNLLPLDNEPWIKLLGPTERSLGQVDGHRYAAVVTSPAVLEVYYNKADFASAGITAMPRGYGELLADARLIKRRDPGVAPFFEVGGDKWPLQRQVQVQMTDLPTSFWSALNANKASWTGLGRAGGAEPGGAAADRDRAGTPAAAATPRPSPPPTPPAPPAPPPSAGQSAGAPVATPARCTRWARASAWTTPAPPPPAARRCSSTPATAARTRRGPTPPPARCP